MTAITGSNTARICEHLQGHTAYLSIIIDFNTSHNKWELTDSAVTIKYSSRVVSTHMGNTQMNSELRRSRRRVTVCEASKSEPFLFATESKQKSSDVRMYHVYSLRPLGLGSIWLK